MSNWTRPEKNRWTGKIVYRSKCGKFRIERKEWVLPYAHVSYRLFYHDGNKVVRHEYDRLSDAKEATEDMTPENGYNLQPLPSEAS